MAHLILYTDANSLKTKRNHPRHQHHKELSTKYFFQHSWAASNDDPCNSNSCLCGTIEAFTWNALFFNKTWQLHTNILNLSSYTSTSPQCFCTFTFFHLFHQPVYARFDPPPEKKNITIALRRYKRPLKNYAPSNQWVMSRLLSSRLWVVISNYFQYENTCLFGRAYSSFGFNCFVQIELLVL